MKFQSQNTSFMDFWKFCGLSYDADMEGGNFGLALKKTITSNRTIVVKPAYIIMSSVTWEE